MARRRQAPKVGWGGDPNKLARRLARMQAAKRKRKARFITPGKDA